MSTQKSVLLLDDVGGPMAALAERLRELGFRALRTKTPADGLRLVQSATLGVGAVLVPPDLPVADLAGTLAALRAHASEETLEFLVVGRRPGRAQREQLRAAGLHLTLWEPFEDGPLRFQVNRALDGGGDSAARRAQRVPTELQAHVRGAGREKVVSVYSLSVTGAFLATQRPWLPGTELELELPLEPCGVCVQCRVVYTNVSGNLQRGALPTGMAVAFEHVAPEFEQAIGRHVLDEERELSLDAKQSGLLAWLGPGWPRRR